MGGAVGRETFSQDFQGVGIERPHTSKLNCMLMCIFGMSFPFIAKSFYC